MVKKTEMKREEYQELDGDYDIHVPFKTKDGKRYKLIEIFSPSSATADEILEKHCGIYKEVMKFDPHAIGATFEQAIRAMHEFAAQQVAEVTKKKTEMMSATAEEMLAGVYGCKDIDDLKKCFINDDISLTMILEAMNSFAALVVAEATKDCYPKEFVEWFTGEKSPVSILYGNQKERFATTKKDYTIDKLLNYWANNVKQ